MMPVEGVAWRSFRFSTDDLPKVARGEAVRKLHSYTTPAILVIPLESVDAAYLGWLLAETEDRKG